LKALFSGTFKTFVERTLDSVPKMSGIVGLIKSKPLKPVIAPVHNHPYAIALEFPDEPARLFDGDLKLLLMDG
jgi:hypothetical protein